MTDQKSSLDDVVSKLKQERDELKLQMHLASMEAKDEYERISGQVDELSGQYEPVKDAVYRKFRGGTGRLFPRAAPRALHQTGADHGRSQRNQPVQARSLGAVRL